jgi:hypothetical protein
LGSSKISKKSLARADLPTLGTVHLTLWGAKLEFADIVKLSGSVNRAAKSGKLLGQTSYSPHEVLKAYRAAAGKVSVNKLAAMIASALFAFCG